jgi:hypothetical protein
MPPKKSRLPMSMPFVAQDRVGGGDVEIEIRQQKMVEIVLALHASGDAGPSGNAI